MHSAVCCEEAAVRNCFGLRNIKMFIYSKQNGISTINSVNPSVLLVEFRDIIGLDGWSKIVDPGRIVTPDCGSRWNRRTSDILHMGRLGNM